MMKNSFVAEVTFKYLLKLFFQKRHCQKLPLPKMHSKKLHPLYNIVKIASSKKTLCKIAPTQKDIIMMLIYTPSDFFSL